MNHYVRPTCDMPGIYLYRNPVDFRKSFRGLAAIVEQELGHNPFDGGLYAFTNPFGAKIESLLSSCFTIVEIEHTTKPFTTLNGLID